MPKHRPAGVALGPFPIWADARKATRRFGRSLTRSAISISTALSHGSTSSFDRAPHGGSRRIRVTNLPRSPWHALALHDERRTCGPAVPAPATSLRLRSTRAGASANSCHLRRRRARPGGSSRHRRPLRSCPASAVPDARPPLLWPRWSVLSPHSFLRRCGRRRLGGNPRGARVLHCVPALRVPPAPACHEVAFAGGE